MNYDLELHNKRVGTYTAKDIADKLGVTPQYVLKAASYNLKIKKKWTVSRSNRELTTEDRKTIIKKQKKLKIVGSKATIRSSSSGRTYKLPVWSETLN